MIGRNFFFAPNFYFPRNPFKFFEVVYTKLPRTCSTDFGTGSRRSACPEGSQSPMRTSQKRNVGGPNPIAIFFYTSCPFIILIFLHSNFLTPLMSAVKRHNQSRNNADIIKKGIICFKKIIIVRILFFIILI